MSVIPFVFHFDAEDSLIWKEKLFKDGYIEGVGINAHLSDNLSDTLNYDDYGEWINITLGKSFLEIKTDALGFYRVFYYQLGCILIISNDFDALVFYLKSCKFKINVNEKLVKLMFNVKNNYFNYMISDDTFCEQIKVLEPGQKITFEKNQFNILNKNVYDLFDYKNSSYEELMNLGIKYFKKIINKFRESGKKINLHLSGGYDSRVCLALLLHALPSSEIYVTTAIPNESLKRSAKGTIEKDFVIALTICKTFGLSLFREQSIQNLRLGYSSNLCNIKNFINNNSFSVSMNSKRTVGSFDVIEIRGGAGELLRGSEYLDSIKDQLVGTESSVDDDLEIVFNSFSKNFDYQDGSEKNYFSYINKRYPGKNIFEKFDYRFVNSRNNRHFGHHRRSIAEGRHTFHPLANPFFMAASRLISYEERKSGKIALDIISKLNKQLLEIPFASDFSENSKKNVLSLEEAFTYFGKEDINTSKEIISMTNRDGMSSESLYNNLIYMLKRSEYFQEKNSYLKKMFRDIKLSIEKTKKFDHILHNKLFSLLSVYEPNYTSFIVFKNELKNNNI